MTDAELIKALGGTAALAAVLGLRLNHVSNWHKRGIPWRFRYEIAQMAAGRGVPLPPGFLPNTRASGAPTRPVPELREAKSPAEALGEIDAILKRDKHLLPKPRKRA